MADQELQSFIEGIAKDSHLRIEEDLGDGFVRLRTDEAQRRQAAQDIRSSEDIVIELLRNSRDAHARSIYVATTKEGSERTITVIDDGDGIPMHLHERIFEPRVTSKLDSVHMDSWGVHGRGMALYSVKMNAQQARVMCSAPGLGTALLVQSDTTKLREKADQSTFPKFLHTDSNEIALRGPKNIIRTVCEFALEQKSNIHLFFGTPAEIAAALYWNGYTAVQSSQTIFSSDNDALPITLRISNADDPREYAQVAADLGLALSERTARRILDQQIPPAESVLYRIAQALQAPEQNSSLQVDARGRDRKWGRNAHSARNRAPRITTQDAQIFLKEAMRSFPDLADKYYLDSGVEASVRQRNGKLTIEIPLEPND